MYGNIDTDELIKMSYEVWNNYENKTTKIKKENICEYCGAHENYFVKRDGYLICTGCGMIIEDIIISEDAYWNNYMESDGALGDNSNVGYVSNTNNPYIDHMATVVGKGIKIEYINKKLEKKSIDLSRLHMQQSYSHKAKSYDNAVGIIEKKMGNDFPKCVLDIVKKLWADVMLAGKVTRAGVREGLLACCLYYACIDCGCPSTPIQICEKFGMEGTKQFIKGDKEFKETFENNPKWGHLFKKNTEIDTLFTSFGNKLNLDFVVIQNCQRLYPIYKKKLNKVIPKSAVAGIILFVCIKEKIDMPKTKISKMLGVCIPTLTKTLEIINKVNEKITKKKKLDLPSIVSKKDYKVVNDGPELIPLGGGQSRSWFK